MMTETQAPNRTSMATFEVSCVGLSCLNPRYPSVKYPKTASVFNIFVLRFKSQ